MYLILNLDESCFFECLVCSVLVDSLDTPGSENDRYCLLEFRDKDFLLLEVCVFSNVSARVKLRRTSTV